MNQATAPAESTTHLHLAHLSSWLQAEQRIALRNLAQCGAACDEEDAIFWARRHAQLSITSNVVRWFTEAATL